MMLVNTGIFFQIKVRGGGGGGGEGGGWGTEKNALKMTS